MNSSRIPKLLIVDDELRVREAIHRNICELDLDIHMASSGEDALSMIESDDYAVILLDIMMPGMSGLELLEKVSDISPNSQVIMVTAFGEKEHLYKALKYNAFDFLDKPLDMEILIKRVNNAIERYETQRLINLFIEQYLIETLDFDPTKIENMTQQEKARLLSQTEVLLRLKESKRSVAQ